jgi:hypothetical protein
MEILKNILSSTRSVLFSCRYSFLLISCLLILSSTSVNREYQLKAVFLFNFTQFVEWPSSTFSSQNSPIIIGILGNDPFGSYLDETVSDEKVNGHPIVVKRYSAIGQAENSHVLFINLSQPSDRIQALEALKGKSILTVGEAPNFISEGGMIKFIMANNKIQFQINPEAARASDLMISSKLLRLAQVVIPK